MKSYINGFAKFITTKAITYVGCMVKFMMILNGLMLAYGLYCDISLGREKQWGMAVFFFIMSTLFLYIHYADPDTHEGFWLSCIFSLVLLAKIFYPIFNTRILQSVYIIYCVLLLYAATAIPKDIRLAKRRANRGLLFILFSCWCLSFVINPINSASGAILAIVGIRVYPFVSYVTIVMSFKVWEMRNSGEMQTEIKLKSCFFSLWLPIIITYLSIHVFFPWAGISFLSRGTQVLPDKYAALTLVYFVYISTALNKRR